MAQPTNETTGSKLLDAKNKVIENLKIELGASQRDENYAKEANCLLRADRTAGNVLAGASAVSTGIQVVDAACKVYQYVTLPTTASMSVKDVWVTFTKLEIHFAMLKDISVNLIASPETPIRYYRVCEMVITDVRNTYNGLPECLQVANGNSVEGKAQITAARLTFAYMKLLVDTLEKESDHLPEKLGAIARRVIERFEERHPLLKPEMKKTCLVAYNHSRFNFAAKLKGGKFPPIVGGHRPSSKLFNIITEYKHDFNYEFHQSVDLFTPTDDARLKHLPLRVGDTVHIKRSRYRKPQEMRCIYIWGGMAYLDINQNHKGDIMAFYIGYGSEYRAAQDVKKESTATTKQQKAKTEKVP